MTGPDLKPCPFCGSKNIGWAWRSTYSIDSSYAFFGCLDCMMGSDEASEDNALDPCDAAAWNRRATDQATLPEVQALIAAAIEDAADNLQSLANKLWPDGNRTELADRIRALTPADATAALAARDAAMLARGMREAAGIDWTSGRDVSDTAPNYLSDWQRGLVAGQNAMRDAILARAEQIEREAK